MFYQLASKVISLNDKNRSNMKGAKYVINLNYKLQ